MIIDHRQAKNKMCPIRSINNVYTECIGEDCMFWVWVGSSAEELPGLRWEGLYGHCGVATLYNQPVVDVDWIRRGKFIPHFNDRLAEQEEP